MADLNNLFQKFNTEIQITDSKKDRMIISRENLRKKIKDYFKNNHDEYTPSFYIQGSYKIGTLIRTKDDTCDIDDGVWFDSNPNDVTCTTLQTWVKNAVEGTTDDIQHRKKCITVNYKADYNIDLPIYVYDEENDENPSLAIKNGDWREDDPKEMIDAFNTAKDSKGQLLKIVRYLKAWCDYKREKMPSGLAMTILAMNNFQTNNRDDIALKFTLIEIEKALKKKFECIVPAKAIADGTHLGGGSEAWEEALNEIIFAFEWMLHFDEYKNRIQKDNFCKKWNIKNPYEKNLENKTIHYVYDMQDGGSCISDESDLDEKEPEKYRFTRRTVGYHNVNTVIEMQERARKGFELFGKYFMNFWD
jgi:hypothetical protein